MKIDPEAQQLLAILIGISLLLFAIGHCGILQTDTVLDYGCARG